MSEHNAENDAAADKYADGIICYRETNPRAHHNTVKAAFLAGIRYAESRVTPPAVTDGGDA